MTHPRTPQLIRPSGANCSTVNPLSRGAGRAEPKQPTLTKENDDRSYEDPNGSDQPAPQAK